MSGTLNKLDISYISLTLMVSSGIILTIAGYPLVYALIALCLYAILYIIASYIKSIWTSAMIYSFSLSAVAWVLATNSAIDVYIPGNSYFGVYQALVATCISLLLYYIITHEPYAMRAFLGLMILGIVLTRNYTCIYCLFLLIYLFAPLGFKIRRLIGKYLRLIRLFTLPFILVSLPLIILTNTVASCPVYMLLLLAYYKTIYSPKEKYNVKN